MNKKIFSVLLLLSFGIITFSNNDFSINDKNNIVTFLEKDPVSPKRNIQLSNPVKVSFEEMEEWLQKELGANEFTGFKLKSKFTDKIGFTHFKFQQTYKETPVQDGVFIIHTQDGNIVSANGEYYSDIELDSNVLISAAEAIEIGKRTIVSEVWAWSNSDYPTPELFIVSTKDGFHFTYKTDIFSYEPISRKWLFIDVQSGLIVQERNQLHHLTVPGEAHCIYHGTQTIQVDSLAPDEFVLRDYSRGDGIITLDLNGVGDISQAVDFVDTDNIWDTTTDFDNGALDVHWAVENIYDYMLDVHGWNSYDNQGAAVYSYIHNSNTGNAFWSGSEMFFGDGDGSFLKPLVAAEVTGHEFMHAYASAMVDWNLPDPEIGAISEAYSDIFSVIFETDFSPSTANYLIGDMVTVSGLPLRSMEDPNSLQHPDTYQGVNWSTNNFSTNSNVFNYCFYLLTQGGTGTNDNGDEYSVSPISMDDAADILFRALSVYMTPNTDFSDTRAFGIQACRDLYGCFSEQETQFTNACYAIGVGNEYDAPALVEIEGEDEAMVNEIIDFTSNANSADTWSWEFGDGNTSTEESPMHSYETIGTYEVILTVTYTDGCTSVDTFNVTITDITGVVYLEEPKILIYPNPANEKIYLEFENIEKVNDLKVIDALGRYHNAVTFKFKSSNSIEIELNNSPSGIYFLEIVDENNFSLFEKFYLQN